MPLVAKEILGIIGRLLIDLESKLADSQIDQKELQDFVTKFVMDVLTKYSD